MLSLFKKNTYPACFIKKKKLFIQLFLKNHNHQWIANDPAIKKYFLILIDSLKEKHVDFFLNHQTFFIPCQAHLSCAIGRTKNHHLILVFPELITLLRSASSLHALAILAHELGHIYYGHTENKIDTLQAQIEADHFSFELGFGQELREVLLDHIKNHDCRVRISKLASQLTL